METTTEPRSELPEFDLDEDEDEAVRDCEECLINTAPCNAPLYTPCAPEYGCDHDGSWEWYMLRDALWAEIGNPECLCVGCAERRLGRRLNAADFADLPINEPHRYDTPRLTAAKARK